MWIQLLVGVIVLAIIVLAWVFFMAIFWIPLAATCFGLIILAGIVFSVMMRPAYPPKKI